MREKFALITGASMGLGRAFANELAERGINTILVSLPGENVEAVAAYSCSQGVVSYYYETDLTKKENILKLTHWINDNFDLFMLINNAGIGGSRSFSDSSIEYVDSIIQLNITALTLLTHQLLPNLRKQDDAYILNISSMASFTPTGFKTVYPASKNFIRHFSRGLNEELKDSTVSVSVAMLGPMPTSDDIIRRIASQGALARFVQLNPGKVSRVCVRRLLRRDPVIIVGWTNKLSSVLLQLLPLRLRVRLMTLAVKKELAV